MKKLILFQLKTLFTIFSSKKIFYLFFQTLKVILEEKKISERNLKFTFSVYKSHFVNYHLSPGAYEVIDIKIKISDLLKSNFFTDVIILKTKLSTINILRFDEKSFVNTLLGFSPNWEYECIQMFSLKRWEL